MTGYWPSFFAFMYTSTPSLSTKTKKKEDIGQNHARPITHMFSVRVAKGGGEQGEIRGS